MANLCFEDRLNRYIFLYYLDKHQNGKRMPYGERLNICEYVLNQALQRMIEGRNKHTPLGCEFSIQNVCLEAKIKPQNLYRSNFHYEELTQKIKQQEMLRRKALLRKALSDFLLDMDAYIGVYGFRLSLQFLMKNAGLSKDQVYALTIPMNDLYKELKEAQSTFREYKAKQAAYSKTKKAT